VSRNRALWVSTSVHTRGGIASFVKVMQETPLWSRWHIRHVATHRDGSAPVKLLTFACACAAILWELVCRRPDVMHLHMSSYGSFARKSLIAWVGRLAHVPVIIHVHGSDFELFFNRCPRPLQRYISATLNQAEAVIALGQTWADRLGTIAPRAHIVVMPNAVRPRVSTPRTRSGEAVNVLFLGIIGDRKGAFTLIDSWPLVKSATAGSAEAQLTMAGDGAVDEARARVAQLGLVDDVHILGWSAGSVVEQLLQASHVLVLPSRTEGQPMAVLEAMAHGLCVVVTEVGGIPDLVDRTCAVFVPVDDREALAAALTSVITDHDRRRALGEAALQRIRERFDVDHAWRTLDDVYQDVAR
jgi:glycosyltransferase involved in cell wall biosynthesis